MVGVTCPDDKDVLKVFRLVNALGILGGCWKFKELAIT